jgi:hypothetical protein
MIWLRYKREGIMAAKKKRPVGRPHKVINIQELKDLASVQCTNTEIAAALHINIDTLHDNYSDLIKEYREAGKQSLRRAQWKKAVEDGNPTMLIWCGKFHLDQKEEINFTGTETDVRTLLEKWEVTAKKKTHFQLMQEKKKAEEAGELEPKDVV